MRAKLCQNCGYLHEGEAINNEKCGNCDSPLETAGLYVAHLLEMPTVGTQRRDRITSDEEERMRMGYDTRTNFRFAQGPAGELRRRLASVRGMDGKTVDGEKSGEETSALLALVYAPAATLWRINHGWRRRQETGYRLDMKRGLWLGQNETPGRNASAVAGAPGATPAEVKSQVRLFVRGTANALLAYPQRVGDVSNPAFLPSLQYALARGIQELFEVEEGRSPSELIGKETTSTASSSGKGPKAAWACSAAGAGASGLATVAPGAGLALRSCHRRRPAASQQPSRRRRVRTGLLQVPDVVPQSARAPLTERSPCGARCPAGAGRQRPRWATPSEIHEAHYRWLRELTTETAARSWAHSTRSPARHRAGDCPTSARTRCPM